MEYPARVRRSALLIASMSSFLTPFMGSAVTIALPLVRDEFKIDPVTVGWVSTAYLLAAAMFLVPLGKIADIHGRKRIFKIGILIDTIASALCAVSISAPWLISLRFLQGFGDAMIFGTSIAILIVVYPFAQRGNVLGISTCRLRYLRVNTSGYSYWFYSATIRTDFSTGFVVDRRRRRWSSSFRYIGVKEKVSCFRHEVL
jgi:MFS family permease